ncbi:MAG: c-type cytochrome biogenesis protein CcsB [Deltaproteobacteria bacterium]|nr:c-type cytochrome biogenesis protein CcsB [Deltaproteobacteria bacterium]MBW1962564.1 c-type cytochrome biogenesis protein CcsB [Deltaproteobacteria bacterium]MBW1994719.1 c-type cytochrome biogenesis protein CcsB [Deltaproteobacteria bacterium]MBW2150136.1 c-type cytochrome biogenesis protein CcsB [Deltaproteobacteria bacterium]
MSITIPFYLTSTAIYLLYLIKQKDRLQTIGYYLLLVGFLWHSAGIGFEFIQTKQFPVQNLHQTLSIGAWAVAGVFLYFRYRFNLKVLGIFTAPLVAIIMLVASGFPAYESGIQAKIVFRSFWLISHVIVIFIGEAAFALACGAGLLYLLQERAIKTKQHGFFFKRLPSLQLMDTTGYACLVVGFTLLTAGLITGFVYAKSVWGSFWSWDPKEVWSAISWLLYAALLHGRLVLGWRGRKTAIMSILGFGILVFTFLGVNLLLKGHHGDFTRV